MMDDYLSTEISENGKIVGGRKHPNAIKDVKRKLSFMNKKISDLHHQRKFAYKNSAKVKKMVHNQVNQIVKCLWARERSLWSDVDEAYLSQDANITDELSTLQSVHARCQFLFNHLDGCRGNGNILSKINSILSEANFSEKSDTKPLEFISEFEAMKNMASNYGHLEGDFCKKDDFVLVADKKENRLSDGSCIHFPEKEECCDQTMLASNIGYATSNNYLDKFSPCKEAYIEDSFQIIDLFDNMCCFDSSEDFIMHDDVNCNQQTKKEYYGISACESTSKSKLCNSSKYSSEVSKSNKYFNPEEEWKQIQEMNKKIADSKEIFKPHEENKMTDNFHMDLAQYRNTKDKINNYKHNRFLLLKDADEWLCNSSSKKEKKCENINFATDAASPAELVQKAFKQYLIKDGAKNWLSSD